MAKIQDARFIPFLIGRLAQRDGRESVRHALVAHGEAALLALQATLHEKQTEPKIRRHVPRTISRFQSQRALGILVEELEHQREGLLRYKVLRGLGRLALDTSLSIDRHRVEVHLKLNLLEHFRLLAFQHALFGNGASSSSLFREKGTKLDVEAATGQLMLGLLHDKLQQSLERCFRLLQVLHRHEDVRELFTAFRSQDRTTRSQAQEFLAALISNGLPENRILLDLLSDDLPDGEKLARARVVVAGLSHSREEALLAMLEDEDDVLSGVAGYYALAMGIQALHEPVSRLAKGRPLLASLRQLQGIWSSRPEVSVAH